MIFAASAPADAALTRTPRFDGVAGAVPEAVCALEASGGDGSGG
ncbi:hypothetical protein AKJ09_08593 [Labilithrix luteola]|uniref:Uncharacterized protein n=1 Tax=Labilithrix luteola TaxID=1391654 RepID=A0A0K1Q931_9BACT|nr:hypothetical protein AKJ09_08593 [Labilithrix luteola]